MIELTNDHLQVSFPDIHQDARCTIGFQRTLRIPDDGRTYPLPPGLGTFPLRHVDDCADNLPDNWRSHGGVVLPIHQSEALWINFSSRYPFAIKVAAGKINAVSGEAWSDSLEFITQGTGAQDYLVIPDQPWLDGFCVQRGTIRQFVAMPLGGGWTVEEQLSGAATHGGLQLAIYPMKCAYWEALQKRILRRFSYRNKMIALSCEKEMGLAPGGRMTQKLLEDKFGPDAWDASTRARCFVHLLNSENWTSATGEQPPQSPISAADYTKAGLPWFEHYSEQPTVPGSTALAGTTSVGAMAIKKGEPLPDNSIASPPQPVVQLGPDKSVREGEF